MRLNLEQGSQEWLDVRKTHIGASEVPIIMGTSPYNTKKNLLDEKLGYRAPFSGNAATRYGSAKEDEIRQWAEHKYNEPLFPEVYTSDDFPWLLASLDGITMDGSAIYELKSCNAEVFKAAKSGRPVAHHYDQIQAQLIVSNAQFCVYVCRHRDEYVDLIVQPDKERQEEIINATQDFAERMQNGQRYTEEEAPADGYITIHDEDAVFIAETLETELRLEKQLSAKVKETRARLLNYTDDGNCYIANLKLTRSECKGSIDYKAMCKELGISEETVEQFRKPGSVRWTITERSKDNEQK